MKMKNLTALLLTAFLALPVALAGCDKGQNNSSANTLLNKLLGGDHQERFDEFDLCQLTRVIEVCRTSTSRAEAGKKLFSVSRKQRSTTNDSDRLGKYLEKFGLTFQMCREC